MDKYAPLIAVLVIAGIITYAIRLSFIMAVGRLALPPWFSAGLTFVPVAVFAAIIGPELVSVRQAGLVWAGAPKVTAMALAVLVAWRTKSVLFTIGAGLVALWALQAVLGVTG